MFKKRKATGLIESKQDERDFQQEHIVGLASSGEVEKFPLETSNRKFVENQDQEDSPSCTTNGWTAYWTALLIKMTGRKVRVLWENVWELNLEKGTSSAKRGDHLTGPPKLASGKNFVPMPFIYLDDPDTVHYFKVKHYFSVKNTIAGLREACFKYCGFVSGTSSRMGLVFTFAKFFPFLLVTAKKVKNDGHCVWTPDYTDENHKHRGRLIPTAFAFIIRNSWGILWGWFGDCIVKDEDCRDNMFVKYSCELEIIKEEKTAIDVTPEIETPFRDVLPASWAFEATKWAKENEIMTGYEGGEFRPDQPITRAEVAQVMYNFSQKMKK